MKILNFGSCNIDFVYAMDHFVRSGETQTSNRLNIFPGGKGLNQSIALANAGGNVYHAGCIGADGEFLCDMLRESGVDISCLTVLPEEKNGHAIIQVTPEGENAIFLHPGSNRRITRQQVDRVLQQFSAGDIILLQNEINELDYIIDRAHRKGMCIILNPSPMNDVIDKLDLTQLDYLVLNEVEAAALSGSDAPESCLETLSEKYPDLKLMLTLGKRGCIYKDRQQKLFHPIFETTAVDTTAAGDTFTGYFVAELARGTAIADILKIASCASAIAVSRHGAAPSIPKREEVMRGLRTMRPRKTDGRAESILSSLDGYINANMKTASLRQFAEEMGYSSNYAGNLVKKLTGKTFKQYVQDKRIALAAKLLLETQLSVVEIINRTGYDNESYFRTLFRRKYKQNPLMYRKSGGHHDE